MKIKVTENAKHLKNLTVGKEYEIIQDKGHKVMLVDDQKNNYWLMSAFYEILEEGKVERETGIGETRVDDGVSGIGDTVYEPRDGEGDEVSVSMGSEGMDENPVEEIKKRKKRYVKGNRKVDEEDGE